MSVIAAEMAAPESRWKRWVKATVSFPVRYLAPLPAPSTTSLEGRFAVWVGTATALACLVIALALATDPRVSWLALAFLVASALSTFYIVQVVPGGSLWSPGDFLTLTSVFTLGITGVVVAGCGQAVGYALRRKSAPILSFYKFASETLAALMVFGVYHGAQQAHLPGGVFVAAMLAGAVYETASQVLAIVGISLSRHESYGLEPFGELIFTLPFSVGYGWAALGATALYEHQNWGIAGVSMVAIPVILFQMFLVYMAHAVHLHQLQMEKNHEERVQLLQDLVEKQRGFVADAAHELRTPLTTMSGGFEILQQFPDLEITSRQAMVEDALVEARRLSNLVDSLLELAALDSGETKRHAVFEWTDIISKGIAEAEQHIEPRVLEIKALNELGSGYGEARRLVRLIQLLVDNIAAHTPPTTKAVLTFERKDDVVHISMADDGPGIPPLLIDRTFDRFFQVDPSRTDTRPGMGLAIARSIATMHHGSIGAMALSPHGLKVVARIPSVLPEAPTAQPEERAPSFAIIESAPASTEAALN